MKAIIVGAVESTRIAIDCVAATQGFDLSAVVTLPLRLAKRHSDFVDLRPAAKAAGATIIEAPNANSPDIVEAVSAHKPDIAFVIGWSQICGKELCDALGGDPIGYHPAPLPRMRGRAVIPWTILLSEPITASSLFWIDDGVDSGPILAQEFFHVADNETATTLYAKHMTALKSMLSEALPSLLSGQPNRIEQDEQYATWCARRTPSDGLINWLDRAEDIERLIRATTRPYPGARAYCSEAKIDIWSAEVWPEASKHVARPGQIITVNDSGFCVQCGDGAIWVKEWTAHDDFVLKPHIVLGPPSTT